MLIRKARAQDQAALAVIASTGTIHWSEESVRSSFDSPYLLLVAESDGCIHGFCAGILVEDELHIANIVVKPDSRRKGTGNLLLQSIARTAWQNGASKCFLEVNVHNDAAIATYEKLGFTTITTRKNFYSDGSDALVMRADLLNSNPIKDY